ncbi:MAG: hypothetical protein NZ898_01680 [Myxococcota bacterium]|nr:hypothetical protein [Myxococcota bacterium]MDW8362726.1 hypothetical protein [Myxococcales bacterium]
MRVHRNARCARPGGEGGPALRAPLVAALLQLLGSCSEGADDPSHPAVVVYTASEHALLAERTVAVLGGAVGVRASEDPAAAASDGNGSTVRIGLLADATVCGECYRLEQTAGGLLVRGGTPLGIQYGLADALERLGVRFAHPERAYVPARWSRPALAPEEQGRLVEPWMSFRGMQLHTLHPIDAYFDFLEPGEENLARAKATLDWVLANRGNFVQWVALDVVQRSPERYEPWAEHTRRIVEYAHRRGLRVGLVIQIFGHSNLQRAWDLVDGEPPPPDALPALVRPRLETIVPGLQLDVISLDFGEFFAAEPETFVAAIRAVYDTLVALDPDIEVNAKLHVGNYDETRVEWMGERIFYYFLAAETGRPIVPWIHTVMYYNLFEDAGGAYLHDDFSEHRELLFRLLREGRRVAYYPESAYWVAFDISVPTYLPVYLRSRWLDVHEIARRAEADGHPALDEHAIFSSGWEWGYWQNDVAALRLGWQRVPQWEQLPAWMYAPMGEVGARLAQAIVSLGEAQRDALIGQRLAAYLAGRDVAIDVGETMGIVAQPLRPSLQTIATADAARLADFRARVLEPLDGFAARCEALASEVASLQAEDDSVTPWLEEMRDGFEVTALRARFAHRLWSAAAERDRARAESALAEAVSLRDRAHAVVQRRHAALHARDGMRLLARRRNATLYPYGYLRMAHELCYWDRELVEARNAILGESRAPDDCFF